MTIQLHTRLCEIADIDPTLRCGSYCALHSLTWNHAVHTEIDYAGFTTWWMHPGWTYATRAVQRDAVTAAMKNAYPLPMRAPNVHADDGDAAMTRILAPAFGEADWCHIVRTPRMWLERAAPAPMPMEAVQLIGLHYTRPRGHTDIDVWLIHDTEAIRVLAVRTRVGKYPRGCPHKAIPASLIVARSFEGDDPC